MNERKIVNIQHFIQKPTEDGNDKVHNAELLFSGYMAEREHGVTFS